MEHFLLTPPLVKAARALLEWQQKDLAKVSGLSLTAINNYERGSGTTRARTLTAIQQAFEDNGIEFTTGGGLRRIDDIAAVTRFGGEDFIMKWTQDIVASVRMHGDEILTSSMDEDQWILPRNRKANEHYLAWAERMNLRLRSLVPEGQKIGHRSRRNYRSISPEIIGKITYCIYYDKIAFCLWKKKQIIVLRNIAIVETFRNQFNYLWKIAKAL